MISTIEMEVAIMQNLNIRRNLCVPNVSWGISDSVKARQGGDGALHECDLLYLTPSDYATEIEIKVEKGDLLREKEKKHTHNHRYISRLYYAVPENIKHIAEDNIPPHAGLIVVSKDKYTDAYSVETVRECIPNKEAHKWTAEERYALARLGTLRILGLKATIIKLKKKH